MRFTRLVLGVMTALALTLTASACGLVGDDDDGNGAAGAKVAGVALSTQVNDQGQPVNARNFFAPSDAEIRATVALQGVTSGQRVEGRWFQLGTANAGAEGQEVSKSEFRLEEGAIQSGQAVVTFFLRSPQGFPEDSWLVRVYVDGELIRTSGFIITRAAQTTNQQPTTTQPTTVPAPAPTATRTP